MKGLSLLRTLSLVGWLTAISCNGSSEVELTEAVPSTVHMEPRLAIGEDGPDERYVFGSVSDAHFLADGSIAILDRLKCSALVYSSEGQFLRSIGGPGSGPGEMASPKCMYTVGDSLVIVDREAGEALVFLQSGEYLGSLPAETGRMPDGCTFAGESLLVGGISRMEEDQPDRFVYVVSIFDRHMRPVDTLFSNPYAFDPTDISSAIHGSSYSCSFDSDREGNIFVAPACTEEYVVRGFSPVGDTIVVISRDLEAVTKTEQEIAEERELMTGSLETLNPGVEYNYHPLEKRYMIPPYGVHADDLGRIWVRSGLDTAQVFDVYNYSGDHLFSAEARGIPPEETTAFLRWTVSGQGLIAFSVNCYGCPRVYVYDLPRAI